MKLIVEGLDRVGKDTLIRSVQDKFGYHQVLHFSKPLVLSKYLQICSEADDPEKAATRLYQEQSFRTMFALMRDSYFSSIICNRSHLGEYVYGPLYRDYDAEYVFVLERGFAVNHLSGLKLVLLTEDFDRATHFQDDGKSLGADRRNEQGLFIEAFERSIIKDKKLVCVTDPSTGGFKSPKRILEEAL